MHKRKYNLAILIGNLLDHYDTHIYTLLAPFIASVFFCDDLHLVGQIKAYGIASIGLITRPLGAAIFGRFASVIGPLKALKYSLIGVACSTFAIGLLPNYQQIGCFAPILLLLMRAMQSIFASGEGAIAGLYLISTNPQRRSFFSSVYSLSTLFGMLIASLVAEKISKSSDPMLYWRVGFFLGFATSIVGILIRTSRYKFDKVVTQHNFSSLDIIKSAKAKILRIGILNGFSYLSYPISFTIINTILPIVKDISISQALELNTYFILLDGCVIPIAGLILKNIKVEKFMIICACLLIICSWILLWLLPASTIEQITLMRSFVVITGVSFSVALKIWTANVTDAHGAEKYLINALGGGIGMELLGRSSAVIALFTFQFFNNFLLYIIYVIVLGISAIYCLISYPKN
jgi:MFS family permease